MKNVLELKDLTDPTSAEGLRLVKAFMNIPSKTRRKTLIEMAEKWADEEQLASGKAAPADRTILQ